jgi:release factor glutamine methyltransferase
MRDARLVAAAAAGVAPDRVTIIGPEIAGREALARFDAHLRARGGGASVAHVVGIKSFWGREFHVDLHVLAPRPETEGIVAAALSMPWSRVVDLGTGSGCLAVTLLAERPGATGVATDISEDALVVAARNARRHRIGSRLDFVLADWWARVPGRFDLVVSNPPYLAESEMAGLSPEVRAEPRIALTPGGDGLDAYRRIAAGVAAAIEPGGACLLEIGPTQGPAVAALLEAAGLRAIEVLADMDGRDRVLRARA